METRIPKPNIQCIFCVYILKIFYSNYFKSNMNLGSIVGSHNLYRISGGESFYKNNLKVKMTKTPHKNEW